MENPSTMPGDEARTATSDPAFLRRAYEIMSLARSLDQNAVLWQRQGLLPAYPPMFGQEAAQLGSVLGVDLERDFLFPTYRELGVAVAAGVDISGYLASHLGHWHGGLYDPVVSRFAPLQAVVGGGVTHAVGWALGRKLDGADSVAVAYLGDGASSQGDVHEAMNFAAVLGAPVVFFVQNNQWALSVPLRKQVAGGSVAARAAGYGIRGLQVDGDDVEAVTAAMTDATAHARDTTQPVVLEAMTYRRGPHATSDDPGRYRSLDDERLAGPDPLDRLRDRLDEVASPDAAWYAEVAASVAERVETVHRSLSAMPTRPGTELFRDVFQHPTMQLGAQQRQWREESEHV